MTYPCNGLLLGKELKVKVIMWLNFEKKNIILSGRSQVEKTTYCIVQFIRMSRIGKSMETENKLVVPQGWGWGKRERKVIASGYRVWGNDENALKLIVVMVTQLCDYIKNH